MLTIAAMTLGTAVSRDEGRTWAWLHQDGSRHEPSNAFDWTFAPDEHETRFAFCIPYLQSDWEKLAAKYKGRKDVVFGTLCKSQSGERGNGFDRRLAVKAVRTGYVGWGTMNASAPARAEDPPPSPVPPSAAQGVAETIELVPIAFTQLRIALFPWTTAMP